MRPQASIEEALTCGGKHARIAPFVPFRTDALEKVRKKEMRKDLAKLPVPGPWKVGEQTIVVL